MKEILDQVQDDGRIQNRHSIVLDQYHHHPPPRVMLNLFQHLIPTAIPE